jgi:hypothetical protein
LTTFLPAVGMPFGPGITLPANMACTRPLVSGSGMILAVQFNRRRQFGDTHRLGAQT